MRLVTARYCGSIDLATLNSYLFRNPVDKLFTGVTICDQREQRHRVQLQTRPFRGR